MNEYLTSELLAQNVEQRLHAFRNAAGARRLPEAVAASLPRVWTCSRFVADLCVNHPGLLFDLCDSGDLSGGYASGHLHAACTADVTGAGDEAALKNSLRRRRRREMLRIAWRDLAGWASLDETLADLSDLAETTIATSLRWLTAHHAQLYGRPRTEAGGDMELVVFALGKLGGRELNFSSDVDLIFAYAADGEISAPRRISHEEYFRRLAQSLVGVLSERLPEGYVFRVDTLLRPFGRSGAMALSFAAMEQYYQVHGREWERYALIKARPIAGDVAGGEALLRTLRPFIYRRYLDFGAFESLRNMKALIEAEEARKGSQDNIKLGPGGIREIEFVVQLFQLIRGGHEPVLQDTRLRPVLATLGREGHLPEYAVRELDEAYVFLRRLENRLQAWDDEQIHHLPVAEDRRAALALAMDCETWAACRRLLDQHRTKVHQHFERVFAAPHAGADTSETADVAALIADEAVAPERAAERLAAEGVGAEPAAEFVRRVREGARSQRWTERTVQYVTRLLPLLIGAVAKQTDPGRTLLRVWDVIEAVVRRVTYLALLVESPTALSQLVALCAASPWITRELARHPVLLDELLDPRSLYRPPRRAALAEDLARQAETLAPLDMEAQMDLLRRFRQINTLRVAAADVSGSIPLMVVSDHLTELAEVVVEYSIDLAMRQLAPRAGRAIKANGEEAGFAVVAYGKFGGIELGYGSDLDLVFVHDGQANVLTDGPKPLEHSALFTRLAQRVIHLLSMPTHSGIAYEIDMQLRPSGQSGLVVSEIDAFRDYQMNQAWTWESQALVRARPVAGALRLRERFSAIRHEVLTMTRNAAVLQSEVYGMRAKMREQLGIRRAGVFDLKYGEGGITDIEFIVQYLALRDAAAHPELVRYSDNIRQLDALNAAGVLTSEDSLTLADTYRLFRKRMHELRLQEAEGIVPDEELAPQRRRVTDLWEKVFGRTPGQAL